MNLWERFLRIIYKIAASTFLIRIQKKSIESVLQKSVLVIDAEIQAEIKSQIIKSFTNEGGFCDRAGKVDLYYSLFGYFVTEAFSITEFNPELKKYLKKVVSNETLSGIHLYCGTILYSKLFGFDSTTHKLKNQVLAELFKNTPQDSEYHFFFGMLTLYYLKEYRYLLKIRERIKNINASKELPCSMVAAKAVLNRTMGKSASESNKLLLSFYRNEGGFVALQKSPISDLLSTSVALYALSFINSDIRNIRFDCLSFVDKLYLNGGFRATELDFEIDVEYTFYGLLALGALSE